MRLTVNRGIRMARRILIAVSAGCLLLSLVLLGIGIRAHVALLPTKRALDHAQRVQAAFRKGVADSDVYLACVESAKRGLGSLGYVDGSIPASEAVVKCGLVSSRDFPDGLAELRSLSTELPADRSLRQEADLLSGLYALAVESIGETRIEQPEDAVVLLNRAVNLAQLQKQLATGGILERLRKREGQLVLEGGPLKKMRDTNLTRGTVLGGLGILGLILCAVFSSRSSKAVTSLDISASSSLEAESKRSEQSPGPSIR